MGSYYFIFDIFGYVNSFLLIIYSILSIIVFKISEKKVLKIIAFYLLFSFCFDSITRLYIYFLYKNLTEQYLSIFIKIVFRLGELLILGYLINRYWLKSKAAWFLIGLSSMYLLYDLFTYKAKGFLNYDANAQTAVNVLLIGLIVVNLLKQLKIGKEFSVTNQMLSMVFLAYFSIHLVYTVIQNFIINQSFADKSFALFYSSYVLLHIVYYTALGFILFRNLKKPQLKL